MFLTCKFNSKFPFPTCTHRFSPKSCYLLSFVSCSLGKHIIFNQFYILLHHLSSNSIIYGFMKLHLNSFLVQMPLHSVKLCSLLLKVVWNNWWNTAYFDWILKRRCMYLLMICIALHEANHVLAKRVHIFKVTVPHSLFGMQTHVSYRKNCNDTSKETNTIKLMQMV